MNTNLWEIYTSIKKKKSGYSHWALEPERNLVKFISLTFNWFCLKWPK